MSVIIYGKKQMSVLAPFHFCYMFLFYFLEIDRLLTKKSNILFQ